MQGFSNGYSIEVETVSDLWSWNQFWETSAGTSIGAMVGVSGIWWQTKFQLKTDYERRLTEALFNVLEELRNYMYGSVISTREQETALDNISLAFRNVSAFCNEDDFELTVLLSNICFELKGKSRDTHSDTIHSIMGAVSGWRSGLEPRPAYEMMLTKLLAGVKAFD